MAMKPMSYRHLLKWVVPTLIVLSLLFWFVRREKLPDVIRVAAGQRGGHYSMFCEALKAPLEAETGSEIQIVETGGSIDNSVALREGRAEVAVLQAGAAEMEGLAALVPLFPEVVHVVVRKNLDGVQRFADLNAKALILGPKGSGMRAAAEDLAAHYGLKPATHDHEDSSFALLKTKRGIDGAIVTTGFPNAALDAVLQTRDFRLLPIAGQALANRHAYFSAYEIPVGEFAHGTIPESGISTVATRAFLAVRKDAPDVLVTKALDALYNHDLTKDVPTLVSFEDAVRWRIFPMHEASLRYFEPYKGMDWFANLMDSLAGAKELLFAFVAGLYLLWRRRLDLRAAQAQAEMIAQREVLDGFLERTVELERGQMDEEDPVRLKQCLDEVTHTKLAALDELTHTELRGDRRFLVFLSQCANLSRKIESKLAAYEGTKKSKPRPKRKQPPK